MEESQYLWLEWKPNKKYEHQPLGYEIVYTKLGQPYSIAC